MTVKTQKRKLENFDLELVETYKQIKDIEQAVIITETSAERRLVSACHQCICGST